MGCCLDCLLKQSSNELESSFLTQQDEANNKPEPQIDLKYDPKVVAKKKEDENQQPIPNFGGSSNNDASKPSPSSGFSFCGGGGQPAPAPAVPSFGGGSASSANDASKSATPAFKFGSSDGKSTAPASNGVLKHVIFNFFA